jgi:hypothetical protein
MCSCLAARLAKQPCYFRPLAGMTTHLGTSVWTGLIFLLNALWAAYSSCPATIVPLYPFLSIPCNTAEDRLLIAIRSVRSFTSSSADLGTPTILLPRGYAIYCLNPPLPELDVKSTCDAHHPPLALEALAPAHTERGATRSPSRRRWDAPRLKLNSSSPREEPQYAAVSLTGNAVVQGEATCRPSTRKTILPTSHKSQ